jgi:hypothetical protein
VRFSLLCIPARWCIMGEENLGREKLKMEFRRASPPGIGVWPAVGVGIGVVWRRSGCGGRENDDVG